MVEEDVDRESAGKVEDDSSSRNTSRVKKKDVSPKDKNEHRTKKLPGIDSNIKRECDVAPETTERKEEQACPRSDSSIQETDRASTNNQKDDVLDAENTRCTGCRGELKTRKECDVCSQYKVQSFFCTTACYKKHYMEHNVLHIILKETIKNSPHNDNGETVIRDLDIPKVINKETVVTLLRKKLQPKYYDPNNRIYWMCDRHLKKFMQFEFTGKIRPWPITPMRTVPAHIKKPDYANTSVPLSELAIKSKKQIDVNTEEDIKKIKAACLLGRQTLDYAHTLVKPGVTTEEIDAKVHEFIISNNAYPSTLNYYKFPKSCCTSVNEVVCHGIPDTRPLEKGDIINIDISVFLNGVHSDLNETFFVGELDDVSNEAKDLVETTYFALMEAVKCCKPGMLYKDIGNVITRFVAKKKYTVVRTYSGHGVGKCFHSNPTIPHYKKNKAVGIMAPGHVFTIEPMINQGTYDDLLWPDGWTSVTTDGKLSAQFEHTLLVTKDGVEVLTKRLPTSPSLGFDTKDHLYYK